MALCALVFALLVWGESGWVDASQAFVLVLLILTELWRFGLVAGMVAFLWQEALPHAMTLLQTAQSGSRLGGALLVAVSLMSAVVAWMAYRRFGHAGQPAS